MRERQFFERLGATFGSPSSGISAEWLVNAERDGINLLTQEEDENVILYAGFQSLLIVSIFGVAANLADPDKDELYNSSFYIDEAWFLQRSWGGGEGARMFLEPPLDFPVGHPLHHAEPIVFRRQFEGMSNYESSLELSQKLVPLLHTPEDVEKVCEAIHEYIRGVLENPIKAATAVGRGKLGFI